MVKEVWRLFFPPKIRFFFFHSKWVSVMSCFFWAQFLVWLLRSVCHGCVSVHLQFNVRVFSSCSHLHCEQRAWILCPGHHMDMEMGMEDPLCQDESRQHLQLWLLVLSPCLVSLTCHKTQFEQGQHWACGSKPGSQYWCEMVMFCARSWGILVASNWSI